MRAVPARRLQMAEVLRLAADEVDVGRMDADPHLARFDLRYGDVAQPESSCNFFTQQVILTATIKSDISASLIQPDR